MNESKEIWQEARLSSDSSIRAAIENLNHASLKIVLVVDGIGRLEGTLTDGDIRRGLLNGLSLDSQITTIVNRAPFVAPLGMDRESVSRLMAANKVQQIPIVDDQFKLVGLHVWEHLTTNFDRPNVMVVMAGGMGTRMQPYTNDCPKPMLLVAGKPMLQHIVNRSVVEGFRQFIFSINYLGDVIEEYFGDGSNFGVNIKYIREDKALGTAGALSLLNPVPNLPFLVTNGDVISDIRYGEMLDFHIRNGGCATLAVREYEWQHPFGVVNTNGIKVVGFEEKPYYRSHINAGVYALDPDTLKELSPDTACDMPELLERLRKRERGVFAYPMHEPWMDVGRPYDLELANSKLNNEKF